jgi:molybdopterin synthase catalytic subunit
VNRIYTTDYPIDAAVLRQLVLSPECGAVVTFEGVVRNHDEAGAVSAITYDMYATMAQKEMETIAREAERQWPDVRVAAAHRSGRLQVGEPSIVVTVAAPHRNEAFLAARYMIDEIKLRAPIWKKEETEEGAFWKEAPDRVQTKANVLK